METFSVLDVLADRRILITGATGFVGKVTLSLLLDRQPKVGKVLVLVRPKDEDAESRFFRILENSPAFDALRREHGRSAENFLREKVRVLSGDTSLPGLGLNAGDAAELSKGLDAVINIAGLISFNPSLREALEANADGSRHVAELAAAHNAKLVHVSTCYVAGLRTGPISEQEPIIGYSPKPAPGGFSAERELAECRKFIALTEARAAGEKSSQFRAQAVERLAQKGRANGTEKILRLTMERISRQWVEEELSREGLRRARLWGWPNTYCYTKALGEQLIASTAGLSFSIVRPSIVESALHYPFPGWNEGLNTSAPVILAMSKGVTPWPAHPTAAIDFIPVDLVAAATLAVTGAALAGQNEPAYHLGSSDTNPFPVRRCMHWVGRYTSRHWKDHAPERSWLQWLKTRPGVITVTADNYRRFGAPALRRALKSLAAWTGSKTALKRVTQSLVRLDRELALIEYVIDAFLPFIHDIDCVFRTDRLRSLYSRVSAEDRARLPWTPESIHWRSYWFDVHIQGLRRWVFPRSDEERSALRSRVDTGLAAGQSRWNRLLRDTLSYAQWWSYEKIFQSQVSGRENLPAAHGLIVASNHSSHLDMGLVKYALGSAGKDLIALAAKDYFFRSPILRYYFKNYTNLLPIGRSSAVKDSLQEASLALRAGRNILIFPEATRSSTGEIAAFKPTLGYLALQNKADILPVYIDGTRQALPKGGLFPRSRRLAARIGAPLTYQALREKTRHLPPKEAYRAATALVEDAVRRLANSRPTGAPLPSTAPNVLAPGAASSAAA